MFNSWLTIILEILFVALPFYHSLNRTRWFKPIQEVLKLVLGLGANRPLESLAEGKEAASIHQKPEIVHSIEHSSINFKSNETTVSAPTLTSDNQIEVAEDRILHVY